MAKQVPLLIAKRPRDVPAGVVLPPSLRNGTCSFCGCRVLLSECSRRLIGAGRARAACEPCAKKELATMSAIFPVLPPGGHEELRSWESQQERN